MNFPQVPDVGGRKVRLTTEDGSSLPLHGLGPGSRPAFIAKLEAIAPAGPPDKPTHVTNDDAQPAPVPHRIPTTLYDYNWDRGNSTSPDLAENPYKRRRLNQRSISSSSTRLTGAVGQMKLSVV